MNTKTVDTSMLVPALLALLPAASGQATPLEAQLESVALFKNGIAVVHATVTVAADGRHELADVPEPVHGTLWVESDVVATTRVELRERARPVALGVDLPAELAGQRVTVHFREPGRLPVTGVVVEPPEDEAEHGWDRGYERERAWGWWSLNGTAQPAGSELRPRFLVLDVEARRYWIEPATIAFVDAERRPRTVTRRVPVLVLEVDGVGARPATVRLSYLTKGMAWAPAYRVDLSDPARLRLTQQAVVKNELVDLDGVEVELISGYPSVEFSHVLSPLSLSTTWATFFQQLGRQLQAGHAALSNVMAQSASYRAEGGAEPPPEPGGDRIDLHYESIGRRTLREGDSLMVDVAHGEAPYRRIVEWLIPDTRDPYGRHVEDYQRQQDPERWEDVAWDAVRFDNPLGFPMTTGPATIVANGRFNGQRLSTWIDPGEETTLRINKALSIRTQSTENEEAGERDFVRIGGRNYRRSIVKAELLVCNHRKLPVDLVIRRQFSGELIESDGEPAQSLREEGVWSVNPRVELEWTISLAADEERTIAYRYRVLVRD